MKICCVESSVSNRILGEATFYYQGLTFLLVQISVWKVLEKNILRNEFEAVQQNILKVFMKRKALLTFNLKNNIFMNNHKQKCQIKQIFMKINCLLSKIWHFQPSELIFRTEYLSNIPKVIILSEYQMS